MNFIDSIRICFLDYGVFKGRARRSEFWWFQLFAVLGSLVAVFIDTAFLGYDEYSNITPLATAFDLATILPLSAVTARRLHDVGLSGWFQLPVFLFYLFYLDGIAPQMIMDGIYIATVIVSIYVIWLLFKWVKDSDPGTNAYGRNPKDPDMGIVFD